VAAASKTVACQHANLNVVKVHHMHTVMQSWMCNHA